MSEEKSENEAILGMELVWSGKYYYFKLDSDHILTVFHGTLISDMEGLNTYKFFDKKLDSIEFSKIHKRGKIELSEQDFDEIILLAETVNSIFETQYGLISTGSPNAVIYYNDKIHDVWTYFRGEDSDYRYILQLYDKLIELSPIELYSK